MTIVDIVFRDWECLLCGRVDETHEEAAKHGRRSHPGEIGFLALPIWLQEALIYLTVAFPIFNLTNLAGRLFFRVRTGCGEREVTREAAHLGGG